MKTTLLTVALLTLGACSGSPDDPVTQPEPQPAPQPAPDDSYTLDLGTYSPGQDPSLLRIANETLVFPPGVGARTQTLSAAVPGDLKVLYTRVGCNVDPDGWIGVGGAAPVQLPAGTPVRIVELTIDQFAGGGGTSTPSALASATCVSVRAPDGKWLPFARSSKVTVAGECVRAVFTLDAAQATGVAIFLPTYTFVSKVSYRLARE